MTYRREVRNKVHEQTSYKQAIACWILLSFPSTMVNTERCSLRCGGEKRLALLSHQNNDEMHVDSGQYAKFGARHYHLKTMVALIHLAYSLKCNDIYCAVL